MTLACHLTFDFAAGLECSSKYLLGKLLQRKRTYDWPYSKLLNEISTSEGCVVPVANVKIVNFQNLLVNALEALQINVYILLKELSKKVI
jgi:hypothetical protein